jgi:hypothetical protein
MLIWEERGLKRASSKITESHQEGTLLRGTLFESKNRPLTPRYHQKEQARVPAIKAIIGTIPLTLSTRVEIQGFEEHSIIYHER